MPLIQRGALMVSFIILFSPAFNGNSLVFQLSLEKNLLKSFSSLMFGRQS